MIFKKSRGKIFGVKLNSAEEKAMNEAIHQELVEKNRQYSIRADSVYLWTLHTEFGFGHDRLKRFWEKAYAGITEMEDHYSLDCGEGADICQQKLREVGVDVEQWYRDAGYFKNENGRGVG